MLLPNLDVGAILERFAQPRDAAQQRAVQALSRCRTAALGGTVWQCSACGERDERYRSCGNRHCPKCQSGCRAAWLERETGYLLPVEYHHVVFTLPKALAELARLNARVVYGLLFEAASRGIQELAADPRYLGAQVGLVAVLRQSMSRAVSRTAHRPLGAEDERPEPVAVRGARGGKDHIKGGKREKLGSWTAIPRGGGRSVRSGEARQGGQEKACRVGECGGRIPW